MSGIAAILASGSAGVFGATASPPTSEAGGTSGWATPAVTIYVSGGSGNYTYAWVKITGAALAISAPAANQSYFTFNPVPAGVIRTATVRCTVTDVTLGGTTSVDVPVSFENTAPA